MRIARLSDAVLVLENRPVVYLHGLAALAVALVLAGAVAMIFGVIFWGLVALVCALVAAILVFFDFPTHERAVFDRAGGVVVLERVDRSGIERRRFDLGQVGGATTRVIRSHEGPPMARAEITVNGKPIRLTRSFSEGPGPARAARAISDWLDG